MYCSLVDPQPTFSSWRTGYDDNVLGCSSCHQRHEKQVTALQSKVTSLRAAFVQATATFVQEKATLQVEISRITIESSLALTNKDAEYEQL